MGQMSFELPEVDRKKTKEAVEAALEKYRIYKYLTFEEREATITAAYSEQPIGRSNLTSDQTASIAIHNVDAQAARKAYCEKIERAVRKLPRMERYLIEERYMSSESEYITDQAVYNHRFSPPISEGRYSKIRWKAFYKLAFNLDIAIAVEKAEEGEGDMK